METRAAARRRAGLAAGRRRRAGFHPPAASHFHNKMTLARRCPPDVCRGLLVPQNEEAQNEEARRGRMTLRRQGY